MSYRNWVLAFTLFAVMGSWSPAPAAGCYFSLPPTFRKEAASAGLVVYGTLANPRKAAGKIRADGTPDHDTTELHILAVVKPHPLLKERKVLVVPRLLAGEHVGQRFLIFLDLEKGQFDPYRGVPVKSPAVVDYLRG